MGRAGVEMETSRIDAALQRQPASETKLFAEHEQLGVGRRVGRHHQRSLRPFAGRRSHWPPTSRWAKPANAPWRQTAAAIPVDRRRYRRPSSERGEVLGPAPGRFRFDGPPPARPIRGPASDSSNTPARRRVFQLHRDRHVGREIHFRQGVDVERNRHRAQLAQVVQELPQRRLLEFDAGQAIGQSGLDIDISRRNSLQARPGGRLRRRNMSGGDGSRRKRGDHVRRSIGAGSLLIRRNDGRRRHGWRSDGIGRLRRLHGDGRLGCDRSWRSRCNGRLAAPHLPSEARRAKPQVAARRLVESRAVV